MTPLTEAGIKHRQNGERFCEVMLGAIVNGFQPVVYNWDVETHTKGEVMVQKAQGESLPPHSSL